MPNLNPSPGNVMTPSLTYRTERFLHTQFSIAFYIPQTLRLFSFFSSQRELHFHSSYRLCVKPWVHEVML